MRQETIVCSAVLSRAFVLVWTREAGSSGTGMPLEGLRNLKEFRDNALFLFPLIRLCLHSAQFLKFFVSISSRRGGSISGFDTNNKQWTR